jgi:predicted MFS family arabinose efflux permease
MLIPFWSFLQEPFRPLIHPEFRRLWLASTVALFGFWVHRVAASWLMSSLTQSPTLMSLMESFYFLPTLVASIPAGIVADCVNRARYLLVVLLGIFLVQLTLTILVGGGLITPTLLLTLVLMLGAGGALRNPALDAELSRSVPPRDLKQAVVLGGVSFNLARIAGPAVSGALLGFGLMFPFAVSALSTIALFVVFLNWRSAARSASGLAEISREALRGLRGILSTRQFLSILGRTAHFYFNCNVMWAFLPLVVRDRLHLEPQAFGLLYTSFGIGAVSGGLLYAASGRRLSNNLVFNCVLTGYTAMLLALAHFNSYALLAVMLAVGGASLTIASACLSTAVLGLFDDQVRSRAIALFYVGSSGAIAVGTPVWGVVAQYLSIDSTLDIIAGFVLAGILATPLLNLREGEALSARGG